MFQALKLLGREAGSPLCTPCPGELLFLPRHAGRFFANHFCSAIKYLPVTASDEKAETQRAEATAQIKNYASGKKVQTLIQGTTLHLIVAQIKGYDLIGLEEVSLD